jgi:hypothetical protein
MLERDLLHPTLIGTALRKAHVLIATPGEDLDQRRRELRYC